VVHNRRAVTPLHRRTPAALRLPPSSRLAAALVAGLLAACSTTPRTDGPGANIPANLAAIPDAEPRVEPIRPGGPNKPYEVLGRDYAPIAADRPFRERGLASWYGRKFHGRRTANGEVYDMYAMTAAHKTLPLPSYVRVRNPANGREIVVRVNDRGPFVAGRVIDLSYTAALKLDLLRGVAPVEIERLTFDDIRTGAWRRGAPAVLAQAPPPVVVPVPATDDAIAAIAARLDRGEAAPPLAVPPPPPLPVDEPPPPVEPIARAAAGFWVQLGAFRERDGAEGFQRHVGAELDWLAPRLGLFSDAALWRLQAGPYASRDEARASAERIREALQLVPVIVERR
jgi:rare lipoprotein A